MVDSAGPCRDSRTHDPWGDRPKRLGDSDGATHPHQERQQGVSPGEGSVEVKSSDPALGHEREVSAALLLAQEIGQSAIEVGLAEGEPRLFERAGLDTRRREE